MSGTQISLTALSLPNCGQRRESLSFNCWVVFALLVINKAGGLIYNRTFAPGLQQLNSNDYLILAGTFHGIHAISR
ncbi:hypothetical protein KCU77_g5752, partial [Aureobasidium melanogenum]